MNASALDRFHVVLVESQNSLNIGAVARAMRNLGFRHLHLVAPEEYDRAKANVTACWGEPVLDTLRLHDTLEAALADMEAVVALSGRDPAGQAHFVTLPEWARNLPTAPPRKTALVFGPEDNGLRQEHLNLCRWILRIPSTEECPSFNLAQAVLIVLYEITRTLPPDAALSSAPSPPPASTQNDYFQLDRLVDAVMRESGFLRDGTPGPVPGTVQSLFHRIETTPQEMGILLGLFGRLHRTLLRNRADDSIQ